MDAFELTSWSQRLPYVDECGPGHCRPDTGQRYLTCLPGWRCAQLISRGAQLPTLLSVISNQYLVTPNPNTFYVVIESAKCVAFNNFNFLRSFLESVSCLVCLGIICLGGIHMA